MEKLTIAHLAPYLPYGLEAVNLFNETVKIVGLQKGNEAVSNELWVFKKDNRWVSGYLYGCKPILRPLPQLTHDEMEEIIKAAWGWEEVVSFHGVDSISVCIKGADYDPLKFAPGFHDDYDLQYIEEQEESCGADAIVTVPIPFKLTDVISYGWHDEFMYSVDIKHHVRFIQELYKRHFDLHGLLKSGLAIEKGARA